MPHKFAIITEKRLLAGKSGHLSQIFVFEGRIVAQEPIGILDTLAIDVVRKRCIELLIQVIADIRSTSACSNGHIGNFDIVFKIDLLVVHEVMQTIDELRLIVFGDDFGRR